MKNHELYNKTVDILVQAYFNDTLQHLNCAACAVGNIIAANLGIPLKKIPKNFIYTSFDVEERIDPPRDMRNKVVKWFKNTPDQNTIEYKKNIGYSGLEMRKIERSFERAEGLNRNEKMFNGLMGVVEILDEIHENRDTSITSNSKSKFNKVKEIV